MTDMHYKLKTQLITIEIRALHINIHVHLAHVDIKIILTTFPKLLDSVLRVHLYEEIKYLLLH